MCGSGVAGPATVQPAERRVVPMRVQQPAVTRIRTWRCAAASATCSALHAAAMRSCCRRTHAGDDARVRQWGRGEQRGRNGSVGARGCVCLSAAPLNRIRRRTTCFPSHRPGPARTLSRSMALSWRASMARILARSLRAAAASFLSLQTCSRASLICLRSCVVRCGRVRSRVSGGNARQRAEGGGGSGGQKAPRVPNCSAPIHTGDPP